MHPGNFIKYDILTFEFNKFIKDKIYLPIGMKFYQIRSNTISDIFNDREYFFKSYVGITKYSEEKLNYSHNKYSANENDKIINSTALRVYNLFNKYLIYYISHVDILSNTKLQLVDQIPKLRTLYYKEYLDRCFHEFEEFENTNSKPLVYNRLDDLIIRDGIPVITCTSIYSFFPKDYNIAKSCMYLEEIPTFNATRCLRDEYDKIFTSTLKILCTNEKYLPSSYQKC